MISIFLKTQYQVCTTPDKNYKSKACTSDVKILPFFVGIRKVFILSYLNITTQHHLYHTNPTYPRRRRYKGFRLLSDPFSFENYNIV